MASHSSMTQRGQPIELAPRRSAWGKVPSARHRQSVRRLTPTRSKTSGTRNMASLETLDDISASPTAHTDRASIPPNHPGASQSWPNSSKLPESKPTNTPRSSTPSAGVNTAAGTATRAVPAPAQVPHTTAAVGTERLDLVVMAQSYEAAGNARERSRTHQALRRSPYAADMSTTATVARSAPAAQALTPGRASTLSNFLNAAADTGPAARRRLARDGNRAPQRAALVSPRSCVPGHGGCHRVRSWLVGPGVAATVSGLGWGCRWACRRPLAG